MRLQEELEAARLIALAGQRKEHDLRYKTHCAEHERQMDDREAMLTQLRPALPGEYEAWLLGYLQAGGEPTHFYDYATPKMWVATKTLIVRPLHGSSSFAGIIIPKHLTDDGGMTGHTPLYLMHNYLHRGFHDRTPNRRFAPVYVDTNLD